MPSAEPRTTFTVNALPHPLRTDAYVAEIPVGTSIGEMLPDAHPQTCVDIGGVPVPRERWHLIRPKPDAIVTVRLRPAGGNGAKIARTIAQIAIAAVALMTGNPWLAAAVMIGGNMALNELIPPPIPSLDRPDTSFNRRRAITGTQNQANPYGVIPCVLGEMRWYPPYASAPFTELVGEQQYLRGLLMLGYGPMDVSDIRIGQTPIGNYEGVEYEIGADPKLFSNDVTEESLAVALNEDNDTATRTTGVDCEEISIDLTFPSGLFSMTGGGKTRFAQIDWTVQYRAAGTMDPWLNAFNATGYQVSADWITQPGGSLIRMNSARRETARAGIRWKVPKGQYDVKLFRSQTTYHGDASSSGKFSACTWTALRTIKYTNPSTVPGTVLFAFRIKATDQLNGLLDRVNMVTYKHVTVWNGAAWVDQASSNPAWIYAYVLSGSATERPIDKATRFHLQELVDWAAECTTRSWAYNGVIDQPTTAFALAQDIAAAGRASFSLRDGKYTIVRDLPDLVPVQHFTPRNSWGFSGSRAFTDLPHALRVKFVNPLADWQQDERIVYADGYDENTAVRFQTLELRGVTHHDQAWRHGRYWLACAERRSERFTWEADWENLVCTRGDAVRVTHDVLRVGLGYGRLKAVTRDGGNNVTGLTLDNAVTMETGKTYVIGVRNSANAYALQPVVTVAGVDQVELVVNPPAAMAGVAAGDLFVFGESAAESLTLKVSNIEYGPDLSAKLTAVLAADEVHDADGGVPPAWESGASAVIDPAIVRCCPPEIQAVRSDYTITPRDTGGIGRPTLMLMIK